MTLAAQTVIVLQARMGSARLPGKVLAPIGNWPLVSFCVARLTAAHSGPVVLATTTLEEDEPLRRLGAELGVHTHAGPAHDVLARFAQVAEAFPAARYIVRATADNPFVDVDASRRVLLGLEAGADHVVETGLPLGAAVEGIRREALLRAQREAATPYDREHVTPWIRRAADLQQAQPLAPPSVHAPDVRLTVDTPEDLAWIRRLAESLGTNGTDVRLAPLHAVIHAARRLAVGAVA